MERFKQWLRGKKGGKFITKDGRVIFIGGPSGGGGGIVSVESPGPGSTDTGEYAYDTYNLLGRTLPVEGTGTEVIAARQAGDISSKWRSHTGSHLAAYDLRVGNGDALVVSHGQGAYMSMWYDGKKQEYKLIDDYHFTPLQAITTAEAYYKGLNRAELPK